MAGIAYAKLIEAGKGQMLAAGAIVLGYGVVGSLFGFVISLILSYKANRIFIIKLNVILLALNVLAVIYFFVTIQNNQHQRDNKSGFELPVTPTDPGINQIKLGSVTLGKAAQLNSSSSNAETPNFKNVTSMGLGMFQPDISGKKAMYFYHKPDMEQNILFPTPIDSITFNLDQYNNINIETAPPWLNPQHLKLDYGFMFFKVVTVYSGFIEIEVNVENGRTSFVSSGSGTLKYWPDFLLSVHSIEFLQPETQKIKIKPMDHASDVLIPYSIMQPKAVQHDWILIELLDNNYNQVGEGWIKWRQHDTMLIGYSLLS